MNMGKNIEDHQIILHEGSKVCNLILDPLHCIEFSVLSNKF